MSDRGDAVPGNSGEVVPADQPARDRIGSELDETLFVDAGAGSGKTAALVGRVLALVTSGTAELSRIAAITFTDKAAVELRARIRLELDAFIAGRPRDGWEVGRCRLALEQLDGAAIGTIHSFARRILSEHPIEVGLPLRIEVLDEVAASVAFDRRWSAFCDELFADREIERTLLLLGPGAKPGVLRYLARIFEDNWDLVEERVPEHAPDPPSVLDLLEPALSAVVELVAETEACRDADDKLFLRIREIARRLEAVSAMDDDVEVMEAIGPDGDRALAPSRFTARIGSAKAWPDVALARQHLASLGEKIEDARYTVGAACVRRLGSRMRQFTLDGASERQASGQLQFHDLLVLARRLLRDRQHGPEVRARLHERYQRLLIDELQDTDPIQIELAVRIAAADPGASESGSLPWEEVEVALGRLFMVGDPKQSIYRFRRADVAMFRAAVKRYGEDGRRVELTANFRTVAPIVNWVNTTFATLMGAGVASGDTGGGPGAGWGSRAGADGGLQAGYSALAPMRVGVGKGPAVSVLGRSAHPDVKMPASELRAVEAAEVVAAIRLIVNEGWTVYSGEGASGSEGVDGQGWRPARLGDIAVLVPARTSLPLLENALGDAGIAFRAESSSLVYRARAVRDLLMVLRAVDDPTNELHVFSALRTPLLGCGDDDLFRYHVEQHGSWDYLAAAGLPPVNPSSATPERCCIAESAQPEEGPAYRADLERILDGERASSADTGDPTQTGDPVRDGLAYLRSLYEIRAWTAPPELAALVAEDRRAFELGMVDGRPRDTWRRLRFVIDQARAWHEATGGNLRQYLAWTSLQAAEDAHVEEAFLPEPDDDAIRIMTIHAAKGLEFPVTILSGMSAGPRSRPVPAKVLFPWSGGVGYKLSGGVRTVEYTQAEPAENEAEYRERIRLLYVACTRSRDHLVVSLHRKARTAIPEAAARTDAELLVDGMGDLLQGLPDAASPVALEPAVPPAQPPSHALATPTPLPTPTPTPTPAMRRSSLSSHTLFSPSNSSTPSPGAPLPPFDEWRDERAAILARAAKRRTVSATHLTEEGTPDPGKESESAPETAVSYQPESAPEPASVPESDAGRDSFHSSLKGRLAGAVGRVVHRILHEIDLATGEGLEELAARECDNEDAAGCEEHVRRLVELGLEAPSVREAAVSPHWREMYVGVPVAGRVLEGYIDLLYRTPDGLVIVDYKTSGTPASADLDRRVDSYRNQGAAYALAAALATGERVVRVTFLFLTPGQAVERHLPDLDLAVVRARELMVSGQDMLV